MAKKNWIAGAIGKPGSLHKQMGIPQGQKIPAGKLAKAAAAGGLLGKRARLAQTLGSFHSHMPTGATQTPKGDLGERRAKENASVGGFTVGTAPLSSKIFTSRYKSSVV